MDVAMDKSAQSKVPHVVVKKVKKKQGKDELDRQKQAEKKKRRLEKALATSAAIRTELELKKLKKKEEQQRLDEDGAAIAEAVALHVLVGEDTDELCDLALSADHGHDHWFHDRHFDFPVSVRRASLTNQDCLRNSLEQMGWTPGAHQPGLNFAGIARDGRGSYPENDDIYGQLIDNGGWGSPEASPGVIAAQAFSSLQIRNNGHVGGAYY